MGEIVSGNLINGVAVKLANTYAKLAQHNKTTAAAEKMKRQDQCSSATSVC